MAIKQARNHQCQIYDQTQIHIVKGIDNAFDRMEMCFVI